MHTKKIKNQEHCQQQPCCNCGFSLFFFLCTVLLVNKSAFSLRLLLCLFTVFLSNYHSWRCSVISRTYHARAASLTKRIKELTPQLGFFFLSSTAMPCCSDLFLLDASTHINSLYLLLSHFSFPFLSHVILCQAYYGPCWSRITWHLFIYAEDKGLALVSKAVCPGSTYFLTDESIPYGIYNSPH